MTEKTLAIIKPGAVMAHQTGRIIDIIENNGFVILDMYKKQLTRADVETFYAIHKDRSFFNDMVEVMISGPVVIMALQKENAIKEWRTLMGATDPKKAAPGTIRYIFGEDIGKNAVHGSDAPETATIEIKQFFPHL